MAKCLLAFTAAICLSMIPIHNALAHGGGLDRHGCHNETATGGYHCHRPSEDDDNDTLKTAGIAVGALLVGVIVWRCIESWSSNPSALQRDDVAPNERVGFTPYLKGDEGGGLAIHYDLSRSSRLGVHVMYDRNDGQDEADMHTAAVWNLRF